MKNLALAIAMECAYNSRRYTRREIVVYDPAWWSDMLDIYTLGRIWQ